LIALDRDPQAVAAGRSLADPRFCIVHAPFSQLAQVLDAQRAAQAQGMLFDLGVSSPQLDDPTRGFSFRADGPLDMRMDPSRGTSAAEWLAVAEENQIKEVIRGYGEERFAKQIAAALVAARRHAPIRTTRQLADLVGAAVRTREPGQDPATRTFQALRIFVNRELEEVSLMLPQALERLAPGGRLALIAFHSLEDRLVKRFFQACARPALPRDLPVRASELPEPLLRIVSRPVRPSGAEVGANPRARSAVLRVAERTAAAFDPSLINRIEPDAWRS
jgi:16S rRNA (cytosine1402-N4)-methyltransferase